MGFPLGSLMFCSFEGLDSPKVSDGFVFKIQWVHCVFFHLFFVERWAEQVVFAG